MMENPKETREDGQDAKKKLQNRNLVKMMVFELATEFALMIALPILGLVYAGKWFDNRYNTRYFVIIGFFIALALSSYMIGKRVVKIRNRMK